MGQGSRVGLASACTTLALILPAHAAGGSGCADRNAPSNSVPVPAMRAAVVCLVNEQRIERGLSPLSVSSKLNAVAQRWTDAMISRHEFSHAHFIARIDAAHYDWRVAAENIATGYLTPRQT